MAGFADDYVPVNERIEAFYREHPDGSIQCEVHTLTDALVVMRATVYRDREDPRPSVAHSMLGIPGRTNFTRGSEVENAETSAVGRAIAMLGFEVKRGMASREEVWNKRDETPPSRAAPAPEHIDTDTGEVTEAAPQAGGSSGASTTRTSSPGEHIVAKPGEVKHIADFLTASGLTWNSGAVLRVMGVEDGHNPEESVAMWLLGSTLPGLKQAIKAAAG